MKQHDKITFQEAPYGPMIDEYLIGHSFGPLQHFSWVASSQEQDRAFEQYSVVKGSLPVYFPLLWLRLSESCGSQKLLLVCSPSFLLSYHSSQAHNFI